MLKQLPPPDSIMDALSYDPDNGVFVRRAHRQKSLTGKVADRPSSCGYMTVKHLGILYLSHRLAWWFVNKQWPPEQVDHINLNKVDNRISNLRLATRSQNGGNSLSRGRLTVKGVTFHKKCKKYQAQIKKDGVSKYLGLFDTEQQAHAAYANAAIEAYGEFARLS